MRSQCLALLFPGVAALSGCGAFSEDSAKAEEAACPYITGGGTEVSYTLPGVSLRCSWTTLEPAIDGDPGTAATINADVVFGEECAIRVTAQSGVVFPAGNTAMVLATLQRSGADSQIVDGDGVAVVRTYLNGVAQEEVSVKGSGAAVEVNGISGVGSDQFKLRTTKPFDAIELGFGNPAESQTVQIYEFCSNDRF